MLADLELALGIVRDGHEVVPAWHILAPEGDFVILMRFDHDKPEQRARMFELVPPLHGLEARQRLLTAETWLGPERSGEEAVMALGVSHQERLGLIRRLHRTPAPDTGPCLARARARIDSPGR
jgi:hypothetical protein